MSSVIGVLLFVVVIISMYSFQRAGVPAGEQLPALPDPPLRGAALQTRPRHLLHRRRRREAHRRVLQGQTIEVHYYFFKIYVYIPTANF